MPFIDFHSKIIFVRRMTQDASTTNQYGQAIGKYEDVFWGKTIGELAPLFPF